MSSASHLYSKVGIGVLCVSKLSKTSVLLPLAAAFCFFSPPNQPPNHGDDDEDDVASLEISGTCETLGPGIEPIIGNLAPARAMFGTGSSMGGKFWGALRTLLSVIPAPSMRTRRTPPKTADHEARPRPCRIWRKPPVAAPAIMEFYGSSFWRAYTMVQSKAEKRPPQTAKLPPSRGAFILTACEPPSRRSPLGELYKPLINEVEGRLTDSTHTKCTMLVVRSATTLDFSAPKVAVGSSLPGD